MSNAHAAFTAEPQVTKVPWGLPPSLVSLLPADAATIATLIPTPAVTAVQDKAVSDPKPAKSNPFLDALRTLPDTYTTNGAAAFSTTGSTLVDLFADLNPITRGDKVYKLLDKAWEEDAEATLKIIFHARSIHEGKGSKKIFFRCASWLWEKHPRTLLANLEMLVEPRCERKRSKKRDEAKPKTEVLDDDGNVEEEKEYPHRPHGSFDDLNDILVLAVNGQLNTSAGGRIDAVDGALAPTNAGGLFKRVRLEAKEGKKHRRSPFAVGGASNGVKKVRHQVITSDCGADSNKEFPEKDAAGPSFLSELARCGTKKMRNDKIAERAAHILEDTKFQALLLTVVDIYARYIRADLERLALHDAYLAHPLEERKLDGYGKPGSSPYLFGMSYAAKWAPTPGKSADKQAHVATALALKLFPNEITKDARLRLQSEILTPLRKALAVPEVQMVRGPWKIDYTKVPALAMKRHGEAFFKHDTERFSKYLMAVASGKTTIAGASMLPHALVASAMMDNGMSSLIANAQWNTLVDSIRSSSDKQLANCIAVADVSGSMGSIHISPMPAKYAMPAKYVIEHPQPIFPCISLTLLLSELARPPWNGTFITFSHDPKVEYIDPSQPLSSRVRELSQAHWGMNTDYAKVFDGILTVAKQNNLPAEEMVKKIFVFSDMQFDESYGPNGGGTTYGSTEHEIAKRKFEVAGYEMPELVYWNLASVPGKPVQATTPGTALVSGFSGALLKYFIRSVSGEEGEDEDEAMEEDEKENKDEWEVVEDEERTLAGEDGEDRDGKTAAKAKKGKKKDKPNPLDHLMATIGVKEFDGVRVVD